MSRFSVWYDKWFGKDPDDDMTSLLKRAKNVIKTNGWTTGSYQNRRGEVCLYGALRIATFGAVWTNPETEHLYPIFHSAEVLVRRAIHQQSDGRFEDVVTWNDEGAENKDDALKMLDEALKYHRMGQPV